MFRASLILILVLPLLLWASAMQAQDSGPIVRIDSGELAGVVEDGVEVFRGIPYARPPVGPLRWRPPQPAESWDDVRDSSTHGPVCPQRMGAYPEWADEFIESVGMEEDCLSINVWAPAERDGDPLPVMFYIHGGNFQFGSGSLPLYEGHWFARNGVILVTFNYRLGYLGRFAHPAMTRLQSGEPLVNYGLFDQIAALEWVQRNIAAFGGDPNDVTIFGHSAGGVSVNVLMTTPQTKGLFHRAIAQGSGILLDANQHSFERGPTGPVSMSREDMGEDFVEHFEIEATDDIELLEALRALPWEPMVEYATRKAGTVQSVRRRQRVYRPCCPGLRTR